MDDIDNEFIRHSKERNGFCKYTQNGLSNGVECDNYSTCNLCGWNPAVAKKRIQKIRAYRRQQRMVIAPETPEKWMIGSGEFPVKDVVECR